VTVSSYTLKFRPDQSREVLAAIALRNDAAELRAKVAQGSYEDEQLEKFWRITSVAGVSLVASNVELSQRAGLGDDFFASVAKDRRRPKLTNFLKALTAVVDISNERLADIDAGGQPSASIPNWVPNPLASNATLAKKIHEELLSIVEQLKKSNSLAALPEVDHHWRVTLINLLETVIVVLKAPLIEKSLLEKTKDELEAMPAKIGREATSKFFAELASQAAKSLWRILGSAG
jgi:hypothetical protein